VVIHAWLRGVVTAMKGKNPSGVRPSNVGGFETNRRCQQHGDSIPTPCERLPWSNESPTKHAVGGSGSGDGDGDGGGSSRKSEGEDIGNNGECECEDVDDNDKE
jgi:hypothetical protein